MMADPCDVTALTEASCCDPPAEVGAGSIDNPPAQSALRYRLGTFASFRAAMLAAIPKYLPRWKERSQRDYGVVLGTTVIYIFIILVLNLIVDMIYAWLDPKVRLR